MRLSCVRHGKRVQVINIGDADKPVALTVHRNNSKRNDVCDTNQVVIGGEYFKPITLLLPEWDKDEETETTDEYLNRKHDALIYS